MKPRRSSGVARQDASSWPWPTMTCISRPMPESESSSWTSSSRHGVAVDRVLGPAVAEHGPRDRDLGVVDRQRAVGVVDGEEHLGPAERRAAGGAGEDDVLHLAAAQALRALLAHDPGDGVDDVGLAGAVGSDDAGDARLEAQRRRRREGLEAAQGQALEVHAEGSGACGVDGSRGRPHPPYPAPSPRTEPRQRRVVRSAPAAALPSVAQGHVEVGAAQAPRSSAGSRRATSSARGPRPAPRGPRRAGAAGSPRRRAGRRTHPGGRRAPWTSSVSLDASRARGAGGRRAVRRPVRAQCRVRRLRREVRVGRPWGWPVDSG